MKKFEITKEQILLLYGSDDASSLLEILFPDAFKKELEVGKWYKNRNGKTLFLYNGENYRKGFDAKEVWSSNIGTAYDYNIIEATPQEVEIALICEAKKRYSNGVLINSLYGINFQRALGIGFEYYENTNRLWSNGAKLFDNGQWAAIIETITIQEAEKLLNKKIV